MSRSAAVLLGDIGGTTARFALWADGAVGPVHHAWVRDHASIKDAIAAFLTAGPRPVPVTAAVLALAAPVEGGRVALTNSPWVVDAAELCAAFGFDTVTLVNDFEAVAWSLPHLAGSDLVAVGGGAAVAGAPITVLGPGTGLGVAGLVPCADGLVVVPTEGGHATLAATNAREDRIIDHLRGRFGHVSNERVLSGPGLENLYAAIAALDGAPVATRTAPEITGHALDGSCQVCREAVETFCALLGAVAGDLALLFRARGGVFVAGGIVPRLGAAFAASAFRDRFVAKGRFRDWLATIPTQVIVHPDVAFVGLGAVAARAKSSGR